MSALTRGETRLLPDLVDWLESPFSVLRPFTGHPMRLEDSIEDGRYVVRAELPGIDPEKQIEVTVGKGILTTHAERHEGKEARHRSEFSYGVFSRHVTLPASAGESDVKASYDKGILEVTVGLRANEEVAGRQIPVRPAGQVEQGG